MPYAFCGKDQIAALRQLCHKRSFLHFFRGSVVRRVKIARFQSLAGIRNAWSSVPTSHPTSSWRGPYLSLVPATTVPSSRSQTTCCCTPNRPALNNTAFSRHGPVLFCLH